MTIFGLTLEQWANFKLYIGLAGPLLFFVYLPLVMVGLFFLMRNKWRLWIKIPVLLIYLIAAYSLPLGDVTINSINMARMCEKVGLHVKRTVEVDGYYSASPGDDRKYKFIEFPQPGMPVTRLEKGNGKIIKTLISEPTAEWEYVTLSIDRRDSANGVWIGSYEVVRSRRTSEVIAEYISYKAWSGWLDKKIASIIDNSVGGCYSRPSMHESISNILIPKDMDR